MIADREAGRWRRTLLRPPSQTWHGPHPPQDRRWSMWLRLPTTLPLCGSWQALPTTCRCGMRNSSAFQRRQPSYCSCLWQNAHKSTNMYICGGVRADGVTPFFSVCTVLVLGLHSTVPGSLQSSCRCTLLLRHDCMGAAGKQSRRSAACSQCVPDRLERKWHMAGSGYRGWENESMEAESSW